MAAINLLERDVVIEIHRRLVVHGRCRLLLLRCSLLGSSLLLLLLALGLGLLTLLALLRLLFRGALLHHGVNFTLGHERERQRGEGTVARFLVPATHPVPQAVDVAATALVGVGILLLVVVGANNAGVGIIVYFSHFVSRLYEVNLQWSSSGIVETQ